MYKIFVRMCNKPDAGPSPYRQAQRPPDRRDHRGRPARPPAGHPAGGRKTLPAEQLPRHDEPPHPPTNPNPSLPRPPFFLASYHPWSHTIDERLAGLAALDNDPDDPRTLVRIIEVFTGPVLALRAGAEGE